MQAGDRPMVAVTAMHGDAMSMITKANAELELRPLEAHEMDIASGGGIPVQQNLVRYGGWFTPTYGPFGMELYVRAVKGLQ
jgi:hypothetical protein